jgi:cell division protein FtsL
MRSIVIDVDVSSSLLKKQSVQQEVSFLYRKAIDTRSNENEGKRIAELAMRIMAKANESEMNQTFDNVEELTLRDILEVLLEFK